MSGYFVFINYLLKKKIFWLAPAFMLAFVVLPRMFKYFLPTNNFVSIVNTIFMYVSFLSAVLFLFFSVAKLFSNGDSLRKEVIFYKSLGQGLLQQFIMRLVILLFWSLFLYFMYSAVLWSFKYNTLLLMITLAFSLLFFSSISLALNTMLIYYLSLIIYLACVFFPVYLIPNLAYMNSVGLGDAIMYSSVYVLFYILLSYQLYVYSWRKQCIGLIS